MGRTFRHEVHQALHFARRIPLQRPLNRFAAEVFFVQFLDNSPAGRQAQFEAETARQVRKEGIQRAHAQAMQLAEHLTQHVLAAGGRQGGNLQPPGELLSLALIQGRVRQPQDDSVQDFSGRFACERRGENLVGRHAVVQQADVTIRQLERLAGASRRADQNMRRIAHVMVSVLGSSSRFRRKA